MSQFLDHLASDACIDCKTVCRCKSGMSGHTVEAKPDGLWGCCTAPQIFGGSPGRSSSSCSLTALGGGNKTISRLIARPFPLSFCANGFQHSEQISYSFPSISFCRQSLASPQRS